MATRNRYAEIMSQFGQSQPFSFFGMPSGGFNPYASDYTGGFTPYQRPLPAPSLPVEQDQYAEIIRQIGGSGGGGGYSSSPEGQAAREAPMSDSERAFQLSVNEAIAGGIDNLSRLSPVATGLKALFSLGEESENSTGGPSRMTSPAAAIQAAARQEAQVAAVNAANLAGAGLLANPMAQDPAQRAIAADAAEIQSLLSRYPALVAPTAPVVTAPPVEALPPNARLFGTGEVPPDISENDFYAAQAAANLPTEIQSLLNRFPAPAPMAAAPAPAPAAPTMITARETYKGNEGDPGPGWTAQNIGRGERKYTREVAVPVDRFTDSEGNFDFSALQRAGLSISGIGGGQGSSGGGYTVGGYAPGSQAAAAAASGTVGGYGPGTPGFNAGMTGLAKGGYVSRQHLGGPDPEGPDDGYAALKDGEYVINDKAVKKYGIELMNLINSGKISKGKLRGLLEM